MWRMSDTEYDRIPPLTLGLRLKMAMTWAGYGREDMATEIGVSPSTISRWTNDVGEPPHRGYIVTWATFTRCDLQWLFTGEQPTNGGPVELAGDEELWDGAERRRDGPNRQRVTTH